MNTRRRNVLKLASLGLVGVALTAGGGCSSVQSPTTASIQRGDAQATPEEQRLAPMATQRRGLLVAGDGFGRMAYSAPQTVTTASANDD